MEAWVVTDYDELKVRFERGQAGTFRVFASGTSGEATGGFALPFSELELENFILRVGRTRQSVRRVDSPELELARGFGGRLFDALFDERVRDVYRESAAAARAGGKGLRISLSLTDAPELMHLPWEYLYDDPSFLSISTWTPVVRYLDLPRARRPLQVIPPLRILAMVSSPTDSVVLDVARERKNLEEALGGLIESGAVEITWLEEATLRALQHELRRGPYHIFHYIGHGGYDHQLEDGVLLLEDEEERGRRVTGMELGTMLGDHTSLRLAVLNACEGARTSRDDPFSGVASSLVERELPAVIAMQFEITDRAAIVFAGELYAAVADGLPIDAALAEARKAIFAEQNNIEWGTPVLFMRVPDGRIFDVAPGQVRPRKVVETGPAAAGPPGLPRRLVAALGLKGIGLLVALAAAGGIASLFVGHGGGSPAGSGGAGRARLGSTFTLTAATPGEKPGVHFDGKAGERVSVKLTGVTIAGGEIQLYNDVDGSRIGLADFDTNGGLLADVRLPVTGSYTLQLDPFADTDTGSASVTLSGLAPERALKLRSGVPLRLTAATPGEKPNVHFDGKAGERVSVTLTKVTIAGGEIQLYNDVDGSRIGLADFSTGGGLLANVRLPVTGTYTLQLDPFADADTGSATVTLTARSP